MSGTYCDTCDIDFKSSSVLEKHLRVVHSDLEDALRKKRSTRSSTNKRVNYDEADADDDHDDEGGKDDDDDDVEDVPFRTLDPSGLRPAEKILQEIGEMLVKKFTIKDVSCLISE